MIKVGERDNRTHWVGDNAKLKACGRRIALCGREVTVTDKPTDQNVDCFYCQHAHDLGLHKIYERT